MLFLQFQPGKDRYLIEAGRIDALLPMMEAKAIPGAPAAVAGVFDYRGAPVPLIDLSQLMLGRQAHPRRSTRILVVRYPLPDGRVPLLGLIAERALDTRQLDPASFVACGVSIDEAPYLGPVASDPDGLLQWLELDRLLPDAVRDLLFVDAAVAHA